MLLTWVTRSLATIAALQRRSRGLTRDAADQLDPAPPAELFGRVEAAERLDRRPRHVDRVCRAVDLGKDVADTGRLDDRPHRAAGDHAGALGRGLEHHLAGRELDVDLVRDRRPDHRDLDEILLRVLDALADRLRHFAGLAEACTDVTGAVTDDDDRAEAEPPAALDDLGDAVDLDDALLERELVGVNPGHRCSFRSELEAGFAGGIGERLDPPVVPEPGSIEDDARDACGLCPLGDQAADDGSLLGLRLSRAPKLLLDGR